MDAVPEVDFPEVVGPRSSDAEVPVDAVPDANADVVEQ